jgi:hypothetical protein
MPVRRIPKNHIHVTGRHASAKAQGHADFESPLEWEYLILLDFDPRVERYEAAGPGAGPRCPPRVGAD